MKMDDIYVWVFTLYELFVLVVVFSLGAIIVHIGVPVWIAVATPFLVYGLYVYKKWRSVRK